MFERIRGIFGPRASESADSARAQPRGDAALIAALTSRAPAINLPPQPAWFDRSRLGADSIATLAVENFEGQSRFFSREVICPVSGVGTKVIEVLGHRRDPTAPGDRASVYVHSAKEVAAAMASVPGKVITVDFVISTEAVAKKDVKHDRVHAVITFETKRGQHSQDELVELVEARSENDRDAARTTAVARAARRGVTTKNGLLFAIDRQIHYVDGTDPSVYHRNNLRYSVARVNSVLTPLGRNYDLKKCTHAMAQDFHMGPERATQEMLDAYVFKVRPGAEPRDVEQRQARLSTVDGVTSPLDLQSIESIRLNERAARGVRLPDGSTVRIVQMRPGKGTPPADVHAHFVNLLADVADNGDMREVLGFDFARLWGRHNKDPGTTYPYFYPVAFIRSVDGPGSEQSPEIVSEVDSEAVFTTAEYRALAPLIEGQPHFDGVVHEQSGYGAALIERFAAPIRPDGSTPSVEEQHYSFLKLIGAWFDRQKQLGRDPEIISTAFSLDEAEFTAPTDRQYRRRLRIYFRDKNVPEAATWERGVYTDTERSSATFKEGISSEVSIATSEGQRGYESGPEEKLYLAHQWAPPPGPGHISVRQASVEFLKCHRELFNQNPGLKPVEYIPIRLAWEPQEVVVGASYTEALLLRGRPREG